MLCKKQKLSKTVARKQEGPEVQQIPELYRTGTKCIASLDRVRAQGSSEAICLQPLHIPTQHCHHHYQSIIISIINTIFVVLILH